eukprot:scaffold2293_cov221-Pinguiococcus_pyrenoidosus.AAC.4
MEALPFSVMLKVRPHSPRSPFGEFRRLVRSLSRLDSEDERCWSLGLTFVLHVREIMYQQCNQGVLLQEVELLRAPARGDDDFFLGRQVGEAHERQVRRAVHALGGEVAKRSALQQPHHFPRQRRRQLLGLLVKSRPCAILSSFLSPLPLEKSVQSHNDNAREEEDHLRPRRRHPSLLLPAQLALPWHRASDLRHRVPHGNLGQRNSCASDQCS